MERDNEKSDPGAVTGDASEYTEDVDSGGAPEEPDKSSEDSHTP
jgi:hypothetical protein